MNPTRRRTLASRLLVALIVAKLPGHPGLGHPETILAALAHGRFTSKYGLIKEDARHSSFVPKIGIGGRLAAPPLPHHLAYGSRTSAVRSG
jgi:hypothetical protein